MVGGQTNRSYLDAGDRQGPEGRTLLGIPEVKAHIEGVYEGRRAGHYGVGIDDSGCGPERAMYGSECRVKVVGRKYTDFLL